MNSVELVKQADRIVAGLINDRTPPVLETCRQALNDLSELVAYRAKGHAFEDEVSPAFAKAMNDIVDRLSPFAAPAVAELGDAKTMTCEEFVLHLKAQVDAAMGEEAGVALARLHALRQGLQKASFNADQTNITISVYVDPFQQATIAVEDGKRTVTSGTAGKDEVSGIKGLSMEDLVTKAFGEIQKSRESRQAVDVGWKNDLASPEFLLGIRKGVDFGRDRAK